MSESVLRLEVDQNDYRPRSGQRTSFECLPCQGPILIGRIASADFQLEEDSVSRSHARVGLFNGSWQIRDLGSKAGTWVNGQRIDSEHGCTLHSGDRIQLGPVTLKVRVLKDLPLPNSDGSRSQIVSDELQGTLSTIHQGDLVGLPQHRLQVLLACTEGFANATDEQQLAATVARAAATGIGCQRAVVLRVDSQDCWIVEGQYRAEGTRESIQVSRSLVRSAAEGQMTRWDEKDVELNSAHSIQDLDIRSALAVPIQVDQKIEWVLYLDSRANELQIKSEAHSFCVGVAQLAGLAVSKFRKEEAENKEKLLRKELEAARAAQQMLLPPTEGAVGQVGPVEFSTVSHSGTIVAGDLFDVVALDDDTTLVFLGDVMGKGAPAGVMMATVQSFIRGRTSLGESLPELVQATNQFFYSCFHGKGFVTLWIGKFRKGERQVEYVDAGHGHWLLQGVHGIRQLKDTAGGLFIGGLNSETYESGFELLQPGERIILYTDGLVEQVNEQHEYFGWEQITECLAGSRSVSEDVARLSSSHQKFRGTQALADDLTIASIGTLS